MKTVITVGNVRLIIASDRIHARFGPVDEPKKDLLYHRIKWITIIALPSIIILSYYITFFNT